eukprot:gene19261-biopygen5485
MVSFVDLLPPRIPMTLCMDLLPPTGRVELCKSYDGEQQGRAPIHGVYGAETGADFGAKPVLFRLATVLGGDPAPSHLRQSVLIRSLRRNTT